MQILDLMCLTNHGLSRSNKIRERFIQNQEFRWYEFRFLEDADGGLSVPKRFLFAIRREDRFDELK